MAGNFTINVVVTGAGAGQAGGQGRGSGTDTAATSAVAGFAAGISKDKAVEMTIEALQTSPNVVKSNYNKDTGTLRVLRQGTWERQTPTGKVPVGINQLEKWDLATRKVIRKQSFLRPERATVAGTYTPGPGDSMYEDFQRQGKTEDKIEAELDVGYSKLNEHLIKNSQRYRALTTVALYKTVSSAIAITKHTSGDTYYNQQLSNGMKAASYIGAIALAGPAAPFVVAGIVVNEIADAVVGGMTFAFDRKLERQEITNNSILAGNASYGRMRGVGV